MKKIISLLFINWNNFLLDFQLKSELIFIENSLLVSKLDYYI